MHIFKEVLYNTKVSLFINENIIYKAVIENFKQIINFDESNIILEDIIIYGNNLKIKKMGENELEIWGEIEEVKKNK